MNTWTRCVLNPGDVFSLVRSLPQNDTKWLSDSELEVKIIESKRSCVIQTRRNKISIKLTAVHFNVWALKCTVQLKSAKPKCLRFESLHCTNWEGRQGTPKQEGTAKWLSFAWILSIFWEWTTINCTSTRRLHADVHEFLWLQKRGTSFIIQSRDK